MKAGFDVRSQYVKSFFFPTIRGLLRYATLNAFVNDVAEAANINKPLPGGEEVNYYRWWDQYYFVQDEWRVAADADAELRPALRAAGQQHPEPDRSERAAFSRPTATIRCYRLEPGPEDRQEQLPAAGRLQLVAARPTAAASIGMITGGDEFVLRGGYARTHDYAFLNIALNIVSSFPYVAAINRSNLPNAFTLLQATPPGVPAGTNPNMLTRTVVGEDFRVAAGRSVQPRDPAAARRRTSRCASATSGRSGKDLFQTLDGNPRQPFCGNPCTTARASIRRAASSACAPTRPSPGITRCRPASTSGSAAG